MQGGLIISGMYSWRKRVTLRGDRRNWGGFVPEVTILGGGRLGQAWVMELANTNFQVKEVVSRREDPGIGVPWRVAPGAHRELAEIVLLCVSDDVITPMAEELLKSGQIGPHHVVLHASGSRDAGELAPLSPTGAALGSLHPLQSFSLPPWKGCMSGSFFAVEGDIRAQEVGEKLAQVVGGWSSRLRADQKMAYHTAAVMTSNLSTALMADAVEVAGLAGFSPELALRMLLPLLDGTSGNLRRLGLPSALTGPISRGDAGVVQRHLETLKDHAVLADTYRILSLRALKLARTQGYAPAPTLDLLHQVLQKKEPTKNPG